MGFVSDDKKYQMLAEAEYFVFPSYEEGWGIALAEAMYAKCKCITYELEHYRSIFSDYPKYVEVGSVVSVADSLVNKTDFELEKQKEFVARYDYHEVISQVIINLENIIDSKKR